MLRLCLFFCMQVLIYINFGIIKLKNTTNNSNSFDSFMKNFNDFNFV